MRNGRTRAHLLRAHLLKVGLLFFGITCLSSQAGQAAAQGPVDLESAERSVFSQFGEDGVIEKIFEVIEPGPKFAVEFGAYDGITNSNMRNLVINEGWSTLQMEGNFDLGKELIENYEAYPDTKALVAWVWPGNVEILFEENGVPKDLDLLVIDVDSNDYYIWRLIREYRPKVVMIEVNLAFPPPQRMVIDYHPMNYWDLTYYTGASIQSLTELAKKKGYELLYCMKLPSPNCIFVAEEYFDLFGIEDNSPEKLYRDPGEEAFENIEWQYGRNGVPWPKGKKRLFWRRLRVEKQFHFDR